MYKRQNSLHAANVEIIVKKDAFFRYTTIQNWSDNVYNLVTERGTVEEGGTLEWIDGNLGSKVNICLLYTSDAADDLLCVDLGGRTIIQKKKKTYDAADEKHVAKLSGVQHNQNN